MYCCYRRCYWSMLLPSERGIDRINSGRLFAIYVISSSITKVSFQTAEERLRFHAKVTGNEVQLSTETQHNESEINPYVYSLENFLSEMGLYIGDVTPDNEGDIIVGPHLSTPQLLDQDNHTPTLIGTPAHAATPPQDPSNSLLCVT